jgi:hypothetical protein
MGEAARFRHPGADGRGTGRERRKTGTANEIVDLLLDAIVPDLPFVAGDEVALMVNGLGGTPISELYLLYGVAHKKLAENGRVQYRGSCPSARDPRHCGGPTRRRCGRGRTSATRSAEGTRPRLFGRNRPNGTWNVVSRCGSLRWTGCRMTSV